MALTNQPFIKFNVTDWLSNKKLKFCSPQSQGVLINILCLMHKEPDYGKILLLQKYKQNENFAYANNKDLHMQNSKQINGFSILISKMLTFDSSEIEPALIELIDLKVLLIENDYLVCPRMVRDADISRIRTDAGKSGGVNHSLKKAKPTNLHMQNPKQNEDFAYSKSQAKSQESKQMNKISYSEENVTSFIIPTVEQIAKYCSERKNDINAVQFFNFYNKKGWTVGKIKMTDWKDSIITWEKLKVKKRDT